MPFACSVFTSCELRVDCAKTHHIRPTIQIRNDYSLVRLRNKVGKSEAYDKFKMIVLDKIAEAYPKYAKECERQKQRERALHDGIIM